MEGRCASEHFFYNGLGTSHPKAKVGRTPALPSHGSTTTGCGDGLTADLSLVWDTMASKKKCSHATSGRRIHVVNCLWVGLPCSQYTRRCTGPELGATTTVQSHRFPIQLKSDVLAVGLGKGGL